MHEQTTLRQLGKFSRPIAPDRPEDLAGDPYMLQQRIEAAMRAPAKDREAIALLASFGAWKARVMLAESRAEGNLLLLLKAAMHMARAAQLERRNEVGWNDAVEAAPVDDVETKASGAAQAALAAEAAERMTKGAAEILKFVSAQYRVNITKAPETLNDVERLAKKHSRRLDLLPDALLLAGHRDMPARQEEHDATQIDLSDVFDA
jgi:hypothetical protein